MSMKRFKKIFKRKPKIDLRDRVVEMYGEEAGKDYDRLNQGISIGGFLVTVGFLREIEEARKTLK